MVCPYMILAATTAISRTATITYKRPRSKLTTSASLIKKKKGYKLSLTKPQKSMKIIKCSLISLILLKQAIKLKFGKLLLS